MTWIEIISVRPKSKITMSLHFIGIRDFPVLHRQFSSPNARFSESPTVSIHDIARDSKDVLVQRLNDLANRLDTEEALKDEDITALHIDMDRMERVMKSSMRTSHDGSLLERRSPISIGTPRDHEDDLLWGPPFSPNRKVGMRIPDSPVRASHNMLQRSLEISPKKLDLLAHEADALNEQMSETLLELKARQEESNHIHDLLVTRAERAARRIANLESCVQDLNADFGACQSELSFLRLQLRAIEVQGLQYIQFDTDKELSESIENWKLDWADIDQRTKARRRKCTDHLVDLDDSQTISVAGSR